MSDKKSYKKYRTYQGFESLDKNKDPFEQILKGVYFDMMSRNDDIDIKEVKNLNEKEGILKLKEMPSTWHTAYKNFKGGKWDHKVPAKKVTNSYYHNIDKNSKGNDAAIFGTAMPDDDVYIYDHDIWGNISYGYTMKAAGYSDWETDFGAKADDLWKDKGDIPMVELGKKLYKKYGDNLTIDDLRREIYENKDILRRYKKEDLTLRRDRRQESDTIESIAKRNNISVETLKAKNPLLDDTRQSINRPLLPTKEERETGESLDKYRHLYNKQSEQTKIPEDSLKQNEENYNKILKAIEENNNPKEDILYKHPSQIPESEIKSNMLYSGYETKDPELKRMLQNKTQSWFEHYYGTQPMKQDATGKQVDSGPKYPYPQDVVETKSKDSVPMPEAFKQVAEQTSPLGVKSLQKGLNNLYKDEYKKPQLKEDSVLGPKTTSRMKEALATYGVKEVNKSIKVGGFSNMLEENQKQYIDQETLRKTMNSIRPKDGGVFLQQGLNKIGMVNLKEDNDIGQKTTEAFNQVKDKNEGNLKSYVQENMAQEIQKTRDMEELERKREEERIAREREKEREREEQEKQKEEEEREKERQNQISSGINDEVMIR